MTNRHFSLTRGLLVFLCCLSLLAIGLVIGAFSVSKGKMGKAPFPLTLKKNSPMADVEDGTPEATAGADEREADLAAEGAASQTLPVKSYRQDDPVVLELRETYDTEPDRNDPITRMLSSTWRRLDEKRRMATGPGIQELVFRQDGKADCTFRYSNGTEHTMRGLSYSLSYDKLHEKYPGRPPALLLFLEDSQVVPFVQIRIGNDSRFPLEYNLLIFRLLDGNECFYVAIDEKGEMTGDKIEQEDADGSGKTTMARKEDSIEGTNKTRRPAKEICDELDKGQIPDAKRYKLTLELLESGERSYETETVLLRQLEESHSYVLRQNTIKALGSVGGTRTVTVLSRLLDTPPDGNTDDDDASEAGIRRQLVWALETIDDVSALPLLDKIRKSEAEYQSVRDVAGMAFDRILEHHPEIGQ